MKKNYSKNEKGFIAADSIIAILIVTLFTGVIMMLSYNIYTTSAFIKRNSQAVEYIVKIFEETDKIYYDDVTDENLQNFVIGLNIPQGYEEPIITITTSTPEDLVKTIKVKIKYKIGTIEKQVEMSKVKARENLITPNKPDLTSAAQFQTIIPIKYVDALTFKIATIEDTTWYNYENGIWAAGILVDSTQVANYLVDDIYNLEDYEIYLWIPRYGYNEDNNDVKFLYSTSNKYINKESVSDFGKLENIPTNYKISAEFKDINSIELKGIWLTEAEINSALEGSETYKVYNYLNTNQYTRKNIFSE